MKIPLLVSSFLSLTLLSGCWDREELNDIGIITGIAIDQYKDNQIELSVQMILPRMLLGGGGMGGSGGGGSGGKELSILETATGVTIADAFTQVQEQIPRRIFLGHTRVVIFGEELAKKGIRNEIDFLLRDPSPRDRMYAFVTKGKAVEVLKITAPLERFSAETAREESNLGFGLKVTVKDLAEMLISDAQAAVLPKIEVKEGSPIVKKPVLRINGAAVFKKDKLVGIVDDKITRGILWLRNELETGTVTVKPKEAQGMVSMNLIRAETRLKPKIQDEKWRMDVYAYTEDDIVQNETDLNLVNPKFTKLMEKYLEKSIEHRIQKTLDQVQKEMRTDIFGFAGAFHRAYPKEWAKRKEEWDQIFPALEVNIHVKADVRRPGMVNELARTPKSEVRQK